MHCKIRKARRAFHDPLYGVGPPDSKAKFTSLYDPGLILLNEYHHVRKHSDV